MKTSQKIAVPKVVTGAKTAPGCVWRGQGKLIAQYWKSKADKKWRFHIVARNGQIIASSGGEYERIRNLMHTLRIFMPILKQIHQLAPQ